MAEKQPESNAPLIEDVIFYGVLEPESLSLNTLELTNPKVGVLKHFKPSGPVRIEGEDEQFQMWAYPDGIKIYDHNLRVLNDSNPEQSFGKAHEIAACENRAHQHPPDFIYSFVHTDYSLNRSYFTALCWHEKRYIPIREGLQGDQAVDIYSHSLPKCTLWQLENDPHVINRQKSLIYLPQVIIVGSKQPHFAFQRQILKFYYRNVLSEVSNPIVNVRIMEYFKDLAYVAGFPLAEKEFDETGFEPKVREHRQIPKTHLDPFYLSCLFLAKETQDVGQIELVDCANSPIRISPVHIRSGQCFTKPNVDLIGVLKRVGVKNMLTLWKCIILEKHILVFSMNNNEVIDLFESLLYLMEPVRWQNIYIPFLPFHLASNIDAIQSYLIGMSRIHMNYVIEHYHHQMKDIVLFDLDQNALIQNTLETAQLPAQLRNIIEQRLAALGFRKDTIFSSLFREQHHQLTDLEKTFRIKSIFFDGLVYLLNNYRPFASMKEDNLLAFDRQGYLALFKDPEWREFAKQLVETMIFVRLCEYHLYEEKILKWNQSNMGGLFVYCQNILAEKHRSSALWLLPQYPAGNYKWESVPYFNYIEYIIQKNTTNILSRKKVYRIENYLIKYISWRELEAGERGGILFSHQQLGSASSLLKALVQFLLPWLRELEMSQNITNPIWPLENRINHLEVVDLERLFGSLRSEFQQGGELTANIRAQLKIYRQKKHHFLPLKKVRRQARLKEGQLQERASV